MHHLVLPGAALFARAGIQRNRLCAFSELIFRENDGLPENHRLLRCGPHRDACF